MNKGIIFTFCQPILKGPETAFLLLQKEGNLLRTGRRDIPFKKKKKNTNKKKKKKKEKNTDVGTGRQFRFGDGPFVEAPLTTSSRNSRKSDSVGLYWRCDPPLVSAKRVLRLQG